MIQIYKFSRNVKPNLKLFNEWTKNGQILLGKLCKSSGKSGGERVSEDKKQNKEENASKKSNKNEKKEYPEEPTTCCMSGCANCVWLDYAERLSEYYKDGGEQAIKEINERVTDENIKAFLLHELKMRKKK